jgi:hypothetical protein
MEKNKKNHKLVDPIVVQVQRIQNMLRMKIVLDAGDIQIVSEVHNFKISRILYRLLQEKEDVIQVKKIISCWH